MGDGQQELHRVRVRLVLVVPRDVRKAVAECAADDDDLEGVQDAGQRIFRILPIGRGPIL